MSEPSEPVSVVERVIQSFDAAMTHQHQEMACLTEEMKARDERMRQAMADNPPPKLRWWWSRDREERAIDDYQALIERLSA